MDRTEMFAVRSPHRTATDTIAPASVVMLTTTRRYDVTRKTAAIVAVTLSAVILAGCAAGISGTDDHRSAFLGGVATPTPEATITPSPGSWVHAPDVDDYSVVVISADDDPATITVTTAVRDWVAAEDADVTFLTAVDDDQVEERITEAVADAPDLVIGAGAGVVDVFSLIAPQHLAQQFLVIGAQLPEPTENSTAVIWTGATFRGSGISTAEDSDPSAVTPERAADAIAAGVGSIQWGLTGIVVTLP
jgi:hypothetical protein